MTFNWIRVRKELRALAPVWALGAAGILGFSFSVSFEMDIDYRVFFPIAAFGMFAAFAFVLGAMCFGSEFEHGTMPSLLSQPAHRRHLWAEKTLALYVLLVALHLVLCLGFWFLSDYMREDFPVLDYLSFGFLILVYAGIGGPLFSVYLRQTHLAVWLSMGFPLILLLIITVLNFVTEHNFGFAFLGDLSRRGAFPLVAVITLPGYLFAYPVSRKRFLNFEPGQGQSHLRGIRSNRQTGDTTLTREITEISIFNNRYFAVLLKELRVQKTPLLLAFFVFLSWVFLISYFMGAMDSTDATTREAVGILSYGVFRPLIFFFLPIAIGACAVASERELGVLAWQHSFPFSKRTQWAIKLLMCLTLTGLFSWAIGANLDRALFRSLGEFGGNRIEPATHWFGILSIAVTLIGLYVSSLARSTLPALVGGILLVALIFYATMSIVIMLNVRLWLLRPSGPWAEYIVYIPIAVALVLLYASGYRNYAYLHLDRRRIPLQIGVWVLTAYSLACWIAVHDGRY